MKNIYLCLLLVQALIVAPVFSQTHLNNVSDWGGGTLRGLWLFDNQTSPFQASTGNDLVLKAVTTPNGNGIAGTPTGVSNVAGSYTGDNAIEVVKDDLFECQHNIPGTSSPSSDAYKYTLILDIKSPFPTLPSWTNLFQTNFSNTNDGDCFIRGSDGKIGVSTTGYSSVGISSNLWYRIAVVANLRDGNSDLDYTDNYYKIYINGTERLSTVSSASIASRMSWYGSASATPYVLFFADENGEDAMIHVTSIAVLEGIVSPAVIASLGSVPTLPLPVHLTSFKGKADPAGAKLVWQIENEREMAAYHIERSQDLGLWTTIGERLPVFQHTTKGQYEFLDPKALPGLQYYRLRMENLDGSFNYSPIVKIEIGSASLAVISPAVVYAHATLQWENEMPEKTIIRIYNLDGRPVFTQEVESLRGQNLLTLDLSALTSGVYFLKADHAPDLCLKFVKQ